MDNEDVRGIMPVKRREVIARVRRPSPRERER